MNRPLHVFAGPSLPPSIRACLGNIAWHPPAAAGDVAALLDQGVAAACLIDGLFDDRPAPWHKELLALMAEGSLLFGAASMGALRAAELDRLGMVGVGAIYRAYRDGRLTGDDEVALVHGPEALGWAPLTVPMVEVRATLAAAIRARLIDRATARAARGIAHRIHFADRDWPLVERCWVEVMPAAAAAAISALHVPLKQRDALHCIALARSWDRRPIPAPRPPRTVFLQRLIEQSRANPPG